MPSTTSISPPLFVVVLIALTISACQGITGTETPEPFPIVIITMSYPAQEPVIELTPPPQSQTPVSPITCSPTPPDQLGPFYIPNAPVRSRVDEGHILQGTVLSTMNCAPISGAQLEFWQVGPDGEYDDEHRATTFADENGRYTFESNLPPAYSGRPPHIHIRVSATVHETLVTQYYPSDGQLVGSFDLVLIPSD